MNITERQRELAEWFAKNKLNYSVIDADWCFEFLVELSQKVPSFSFNVDFQGEVEVKNYEDAEENIFNVVLYNGNKLTQQLQESVRQAIIWLPNESKTVIEGMG